MVCVKLCVFYDVENLKFLHMLNARCIMLEAMPPNTEASIAPLLGLFSVGKVGSISPMSFVNILWAIMLHYSICLW